MLAQRKAFALNNIFGPYVMNTRVVPGKEKQDTERDAKDRQEVFEAIEDYVEEA